MIWLSSPHMSGNEIVYVKDAIDNNQVFPLGDNVLRFEEEIKEYCGSNACSCLSSGTAGIHLGLLLLDVKSGDDVICSTFTFAASAYPILYLNANPVFVDSEYKTWNMDPEMLRIAIQDRIKKTGKKPKVIVLVHLYGMPADIDEIMSVANEYQIPVLEDAAEALGSKYAGRVCGTHGIIGVYSFNGNKIITTSGGGAIVSNDDRYCAKATFYATQSRDQAPHYQHSSIGFNYRMSNISAGIGRGQMLVIDERIKRRREHNKYYRQAIESESISFLTEPSEKYYSNYWLTTIMINDKTNNGVDREIIRKTLHTKGIETRPLWKPMHLQPIFKSYPYYSSGVAESLFKSGLCLPSGSIMSDDEREYVVKSINSILR